MAVVAAPRALERTAAGHAGGRYWRRLLRAVLAVNDLAVVVIAMLLHSS
ncbi:MAG: hypothetical protein ACTMIR_10970 [Cellulomonadaceae bacterium]